jgi:transcriptional antiterminator RfaH
MHPRIPAGRPIADVASRWYVVHAKPREERRALEHLERQGYECFFPELSSERRRSGRLVCVPQPLFPRYLFIRLDDYSSNWMSIRSTRGVSRLVQFGDRFPYLHDQSVQAMRAAQHIARPMFAPGDALTIAGGPFRGLDSIYLEPDGETRVIALMTLLGQEQRLSIPVSDLGARA